MNALRAAALARPSLRRVARTWASIVVGALCLATAACDEDFDVGNAAPDVVVDGWCTADERVYLVVSIFDLERDPVDLAACIGGQGLATGASGDGLQGLTSEPEGQRHYIEWAEGADCVCPAGGDGCAAPPTGDDAPAVSLYTNTEQPPENDWIAVGESAASALGQCP